MTAFFSDLNTCELIQIKEQTMGKLSSLDHLMLTHTLFTYRPDEDMEMNVCDCDSYSLHQSKLTDDIYDECQPQGRH